MDDSFWDFSIYRTLRRYFAAIRRSEEDVLEVVRQMELDPHLGDAVAQLRGAGWEIVRATVRDT